MASNKNDQDHLKATRKELLALRERIPELERQAEELSHSRRMQNALFDISELTHSEENVQGFYQSLHGIVGGLMYAENFFIAIRDPESRNLRMEYFRDAVETDMTASKINEHYRQEQLEATLFAHVIRNGELLHADRAITEELGRREGITVYGGDSVDWLGVPLQYRGETFGALVVQSYDASIMFNEADEQLLAFVNQHVATSLQRKWAEDALRDAKQALEDRVQQRTQELSKANDELEHEIHVRRRGERIQATLFRIAQLAGETLAMDDFYQAIHHAIDDLFDAPNLYVALRDEEAGLLRYPYIVDNKDGTRCDEDLASMDMSRPTHRVLLSGEPMLFQRGKDDLPDDYVGHVPEIWLGVPLEFEHQTIGLLAIYSFEPVTEYDSRDKELLTFVAQHIATAILRRQAKQSLQQANDDLERRVQERTRDLQQANTALIRTLGQLETAQGQLVESEKMASLGNLVAGVAHEINTPLGVAVTAASHLEEKCKRLDPATLDNADLMARFADSAREAVRLLLDNLRRAAQLVASFKLVAADQSTEDRRVFDLAEYLKEIITSLRPRIRKSTHTLSLECPPGIAMDGYPAAIYRIVTNLVINSTTHAFAPGQRGQMHLLVEQKGDQVTMTYSDDGCGLSKEVSEHIFEPFFTTRRGEGGTGLGMHITYNHVIQLGGSIHFQSSPGNGVTFTIQLPLKAPALRAANA